MTNVLITGGCGFVGSNLARKLLDIGLRVCIIDNLSTGRIENISDIRKDVDFREGDIRDQEYLLANVKGNDVIFHQAAVPSVPRSVNDPIESNSSNVTGTLNMLVAARDTGCARLIYASSSSVYGDAPKLPKIEEMPINPLSPYALTKYTGEKYCQLFYDLYGLETIALRYFNVFGPRQDPSSHYAAVIPLFISAALRDCPVNIFGDGCQTRDFTYIENVVEANIAAAFSKQGQGEVINIACGSKISINELADLIFSIAGKSLDVVYKEGREGEVKHSLADITKAKRLISYEPSVDVELGLRKSIDWYGSKI